MALRYWAELKITCLQCGKLLITRTATANDVNMTLSLISKSDVDTDEHNHGCAVKESIKP